VTIAQELSLPPDDIEKIRLAELVDDIGTIGVSKSVLKKTREAYRVGVLVNNIPL